MATAQVIAFNESIKFLEKIGIENIEKHNLPETKMIYWRNSNLNFKSPEKLISSLELRYLD